MDVTYISEELAYSVMLSIDAALPEHVTAFGITGHLAQGGYAKLEIMLEPLNIEVIHTGVEPLQKHWHCHQCGVSLINYVAYRDLVHMRPMCEACWKLEKYIKEQE